MEAEAEGDGSELAQTPCEGGHDVMWIRMIIRVQ